MDPRSLFTNAPPLIGVVHLLPLPGSPRWGGSMARVVDRAVSDATRLAAGGMDGLVVENYGDAPFLPGRVGPETVAALAVAAAAVREAAPGLSLGVNVLRSDGVSAIGIAAATGARFVRVNVHVGATVTDQGVIAGDAPFVTRERARLGARVAIFADVHVKHGAPLGGGSIEDAARDAVERGLADALLVTGSRTGAATDVETIRRVKEAVPGTPVLAASGVDPVNVRAVLAVADGVIVGTALERGGRSGAPVDAKRVDRFVSAARGPARPPRGRRTSQARRPRG